MASEAVALAAGTRLGPYELVVRVGSGGMGEVYLVAMPLVEDTVLQVGARSDWTRHLTLAAALNCSSRLALRVALATTGLNPEWWPYRFGGAGKRRVVKAPASALGSGVREFNHPIEEV